MSTLRTDYSKDREFHVVTFNNTTEEIIERQKNIEGLRKWVITIWAATFAYAISNKIDTTSISFLLATITLSFFVLNIVEVALKDREIAILLEMERYLTDTSRSDETQHHENLWAIASANRRVIRKFRHYLLHAFRKWEENVFYLILLIISVVVWPIIATQFGSA